MIESRHVTTIHECAVGCSKCYGTGEGWYSNACTECKGKGTVWDRGEVENEYIIEWRRADFSDVEIIDGDYAVCEYCGQDMIGLIKEELKGGPQ
jgi:RecJ-like exonuclease